jgi:hypothetical protein
MTASKTRTEPDGESNPEETKPEDYCESSLLENGSMESIDEHCKNFATSSWTQFKVDLSSSTTIMIPSISGSVHPNIFLYTERSNFDKSTVVFTCGVCSFNRGLYWDIGKHYFS